MIDTHLLRSLEKKNDRTREEKLLYNNDKIRRPRHNREGVVSRFVFYCKLLNFICNGVASSSF